MENISTAKLFRMLLLILFGAVAGYYFGFDIGYQRAMDTLLLSPTEMDEEPIMPPPSGDLVSCTGSDQCSDGQYCQYSTGQCGGEGVCAVAPEACILIYDPVCGCDGQTYGNACAAASEGVSVSSEGECLEQS